MDKKLFRTNCFYYLFLFLILFVFFSQVHPLLPFDTDDWKYCGAARPPYPSISQWNPTKVFPECFQPLVGLFAAYLVTPILGDYLTSLVVSHALVVALFIVGYFYSIQKLLEWKFKISSSSTLSIITVLVLLHFLVLITRSSSNDHLFYSPDVNCYYNYIIPNLLCASLGLWFMRNDIRTIKSYTSLGIVFFLTFLALFSNLYSTVIVIAIVGAKLLFALFECNKKEKRWLAEYIKCNLFYLVIIFVWLIVQLYEVNGNRASSYGAMLLPFGESLKTAITFFISIHYNKWFLAFSILILGGTLALCFIKERWNLFRGKKTPFIIILALFLSVSYLILLSSKVFPQYLLRSDVLFSYLFFYMLLVALCLGYLNAELKSFKLLYPFLIFFFFFILNTNENTFVDVQYPYGTNLQTCEKFDREAISQVQKAEAAGKDTVTIYVNDYKSSNNWPLMTHQGKYLGMALYKHGIIKRKVVTIFERKPATIITQP